ERSDRVIAERWDVTCALCDGELDDGAIARLRDQVPRQEVGRFDPRVLVLSRANRSVRCFRAVIEALAAGRQPERDLLLQAGYLLRTTAVYGNGKFGIADYARLRTLPGLERPFSAQMLVVYLVREFGLDQVEHIARRRDPNHAVPLDRRRRRFIGVGNATGLGMAPFLITHPQLIDRWVHCREQARAAALAAPVTAAGRDALAGRLRRMSTALATVHIDDPCQAGKNQVASAALRELADWLVQQPPRDGLWQALAALAEQTDFETAECVTSLLLDLAPDTIEQLADQMAVEEDPALEPGMTLSALKTLIEDRYDWALAVDFENPAQSHLFWYRSEEKEEPRLGVRAEEPGADREMAIDIARQVQRCHRAVCAALDHDGDQAVATFLLRRPQWRGIVRRVQTLGRCPYGEIRANILHRDTLPIHLLRCKLSFLGAFRFDPRSDRWVRITLFQGAPLRDELDDARLAEDWYPPAFPESA
ncbi:MAG: hypothetical protein R3202_09760, partial [Candidatus Competibacterales bacterium]|nr:hypothetical protein [Candidatus Competibacterales bacterium]